MQLFSFGGVDYTRRIPVPDYQVNRQPLYSSWTDGNNVIHRDVNRYQISGTFTVWFDDADQQLAFQSALNAAIAPTGYLHCSLYAVNADAVYESDVYVDWSPNDVLPQLGRGDHDGIQLKITER